MLLLRTLAFLMLLLSYGCSKSDQQILLVQIKEAKESLIEDLKTIRCREDLVKVQPRLEKDFENFTNVLMKCNKMQENGKISNELFLNDRLNELLEVEFYRVLNLEGGREILSQAQEISLLKLNNCIE